MILTKSEFCQFSMKARHKMLSEFGKLFAIRYFKKTKISVYKVFDFYVEVKYCNDKKEHLNIQPISGELFDFYKNLF